MSDSVEITEAPLGILCERCGIDLCGRIRVHNTGGSWPYLEKGKSMHIECFIEHIIDQYLKSKEKAQNE